jgi:hypothetical protein
VGPEDIPGGRDVVASSSFTGPSEPLFAWQQVAYWGQPLGLVLASNQAAALQGAAAVQVHYKQQQQQGAADDSATVEGSAGSNGVQENGSVAEGAAAAGGAALTSLAAAVAADSWYDVSKLPTKVARGEQGRLPLLLLHALSAKTGYGSACGR